MFERVKKWFSGTPNQLANEPLDGRNGNGYQPLPDAEKPRIRAKRGPATTKKTKSPVLSDKEKATLNGEPYINVLSMEIDPNNINNGAFELDWNSKFVANLARSGYQKKVGESEDIIVDRWFTEVCRNIVLEMYEQGQADPDNRDAPPLTKPITEIEERVIVAKPLSNGRTEIS